MCGRYVRAKEKVELAALFDAGLEEDVPDPSWNIKPTQPVAVVAETIEEAAEIARPFIEQAIRGAGNGKRQAASGYKKTRSEQLIMA